MPIRNMQIILHVILCMLFLQTIVFAQEKTSIEPSLEPSVISEQNLIHPGDLIEVDVIGNSEYDWRGTLDAEGFLIGLNFTENPIYALCKSEDAVAADVAKAYSKILRDPLVAVKILDRSNRPLAVVYGAVKTPLRFRIQREVQLNELIISAGGITENASGEIQIFRPRSVNCVSNTVFSESAVQSGENRKRFVTSSQDLESQYLNVKIADLIAGKEQANLRVLGGDVITVKEALPVYIIGGVVNPKQIPLNAKLTLTRAIASAGGLAKNSNGKQVIIFRRENNETKIIEIDLSKVEPDKDEDLILQPFDIIEVANGGRDAKNNQPILRAAEIESKPIDRLPLKIID